MYAATRAAGFGDEVKRRILIGTYVLSAGFYDAYYTQAQKVRALISQDFMTAFETVDVILTPTAPRLPSRWAEEHRSGGDVPERRVLGAGQPRGPARHVGPRRSLADGLPLGLHVIGRPLDEQGVLNASLALEQRAQFWQAG
jgi:aspartyl-tRNA(Asn)/glutamyl-tRNA(Gln) amidotransferase subunit A